MVRPQQNSREELNQKRRFVKGQLDDIDKKHQAELVSIEHDTPPEQHAQRKAALDGVVAREKEGLQKQLDHIDNELKGLGPASKEDDAEEQVFLAKLKNTSNTSHNPINAYLERESEKRGNLSMAEQQLKEQGKKDENMEQPGDTARPK